MFEKEESFFEFVYDIFYTFSETRSENSKIMFSKKIQYPTIKFNHTPEVTIPLPIKYGEKYVFEGIMFDNTPDGRNSMWCLFLATIYHMSAHTAISKYSAYEKWRKNKTDDLCLKIINFIEDIEVEKYIMNKNSDVWPNIENINLKMSSCNDQKNTDDCDMSHKLNTHMSNTEKKIEKIKQEIMKGGKTHSFQNETRLLFADVLYKNRELLPKTIFPYCEHENVDHIIKAEEIRVEFEPSGLFIEQIDRLDDLWIINEQTKTRLIRRYGKHLKGLNFDSVVIPSGNLHDFTEVKERILPMLRRIRQQLRMITNLVDNPVTDQIGYLDMQLAIQAIASEGQSTDVFEREEPRRVEEAWAILIDKSASMGLRFNQIKEFVVCISESANELTGKSDAWALYSFDNNFQIIKDFDEKYTKEVQARIGSLKTGGLSLMPDAIELAYKILSEDPRERKYLFVITDGHPSGYEKIQERLSMISKKIEMSGVILVGIGVSKTVTRVFRNNARSTDLRQLMAKFITAYKTVSSNM